MDFALLSSVESKSRIQGITKELDKRSCGYKRRMEALSKAPALLEPMVKRALGLGVKAKYVLMDSWFAMPSTMAALRQHIHVVGMIKRSPKIHYTFQGKSLSVDGIYRLLKKRPGKAKILASVLVAQCNQLR